MIEGLEEKAWNLGEKNHMKDNWTREKNNL